MANNKDAHDRLLDVIGKFDSAMLITQDDSGASHARPMSIARLNDSPDLFFAASIDSPKVREIEADPQVTLTMQGGGRFAAVNGVASIVRDQALIDQLWSESWKIWFPGGKTDPNLCLISLDAMDGEYWDNAGAKSVSYIFEALKAYATGDTPKIPASQNAKAEF